MTKRIVSIAILLVLITAGTVWAQEENPRDAGQLFAMGGVHYFLREPLTGGLAGSDTLANLRLELGVGLLGRNSADFAPFLYGGDFRMLLSTVDVGNTSIFFTDAVLRGAFGAQFGDLLVAATAGPGLYTGLVSAGGDATRISFGVEAGIKAIFTWGLYAEASFVAPEGLGMLQESVFLAPQPSGLRLGIGWNFLSATPAELVEMSAE